MKKNIIAALACTALLMASCTTVTMTSETAKVESSTQSVTMADLDVKARKEKTEEWNFVPFNFGQPSLSQRKKNLIAEIVNEQGADILVEPQMSYSKKLFGKRTLTVSGRPATFKDFRTPTAADIAALNTMKPEATPKAPLFAPKKERKAKVKAAAVVPKKKTTHYLRVGVNFMGNAEGDESFEFHRKLGYDLSFGFQRATRVKGLYWGMEYGFGSRGYESDGYEPEDNYHYSSSGYGEFYDKGHSRVCHFFHLSPVTVGYKLAINEKFNVDIHYGFYLSLDHTQKMECEYTGEDYKWAIDEIDDSYFDVGMKAGVGVWFNRYNLDLTVQQGFLDKFVMGGQTSNILLRVGYAF